MLHRNGMEGERIKSSIGHDVVSQTKDAVDFV